MSIVTGDKYLESLVKFVENQADRLIEGTLVLKLNPVGLRYVQSRLEALAELESLLTGAPVDYLRAYISDLGDHRAIEQLRRILCLLPSLKMVSVLPPPVRDPTPLYLLPFGRLKVLEMRGCDLSTSAAKGLLELRFSLEKLICHNSTDALWHVFASGIVEIKDSPSWNRLSFVSCACNGLVLTDESLQLLPAVETLDLSRNKLAKANNLRKCSKLKNLDLGFNSLRSISSLGEVSCQIVKLVLRNNALTKLSGIEHMKSLVGLDLSNNIISNFVELEILAGIPPLQNLWLEGNPICCARWFRPRVFSLFSPKQKLKLDEKGISACELWKRKIIVAVWQKKPSSFGFYSPAKVNTELEGDIYTKRKRISRLVSFESEEDGTHTCSDLDSLSCEHEDHSKYDNAATNEEDEIEEMMKRIESMKREHSVLWLQEFKEWVNQSSGSKLESCDRSKKTKFCLENEKQDEVHCQISRYASDSVQLSGDATSSIALESETSFVDASTVSNGQLHFDQNVATTSKLYMVHTGENASVSEKFSVYREVRRISNSEGYLSSDEHAVTGRDTSSSTSVTPPTASDNKAESSSTFGVHGPHSLPRQCFTSIPEFRGGVSAAIR